jgi:hypothetical protein
VGALDLRDGDPITPQNSPRAGVEGENRQFVRLLVIGGEEYFSVAQNRSRVSGI